MNKTICCCRFFVLALAAVLLGPGSACGQDLPPVRVLTINGVTLTVIEDSRAPVRPAIFPGLEQDAPKLALLEGATYPCYAFVVAAGGKTVLVDTGWGTEGARKGQTVERLRAAGVNPAEVTDILITHMHIDHISGLIEKGVVLFPKATLHIARPEYDYWVTRGADKVPGFVALARTVASVYEGRIALFEFGATVLPGILAEATVGHTPGHTAFTIAAGDTSITLVGDMIHAGALQYRYPTISPSFDVDPVQSQITRVEMLGRISARNGILAGAHIWEVGRVTKNPEGGYVVTPML